MAKFEQFRYKQTNKGDVLLSDIMIGQFFPGDSVLHRIEPRVKIVLLIFLMIGIFLCGSFAAYGFLTAMAVVLTLVGKLPPLMVLRSIKPLWWILLFTFLIHLFSTDGEVIGQFWRFTATWEGLRQGLFISIRLVLLIVFSSLLTFTTSPVALTDALEYWLSPFNRFGLPAHEMAMMMTIALRFVPTLIEETDKIIKAQQSRGVDFDEGSLLQKVRNFVPILVPLFIAGFRRADELALAMEARCYHGGEGRTRMKESHVSRLDFWVVVIFVLVAAVLGWLNHEA